MDTGFPQSLADFEYVKILLSDTEDNSIICLCNKLHEGTLKYAIVSLRKTRFNPDQIPSFFGRSSASTPNVKLGEPVQHNDKYANYIAECAPELNTLFVKIIFPASDTDIAKVSLFRFLFKNML